MRGIAGAGLLVLTVLAISWAPVRGVAGAQVRSPRVNAPAPPPNSVVPFAGASLGTNALTNPKAPVVGMAATPDGEGYWMVASDGGIFSLGDARSYGSEGGTKIDAPVVGIAATPAATGYWLEL